MTDNTRPEKSNRSLIIALIVLGLTVIALAIALVVSHLSAQSSPSSPTTPAAPSTTADSGKKSGAVPDELGPVDPKLKEVVESLWRRDEHDPMAEGEVDAGVVVQIYYDFRCGYCAKAAVETEPGLQRHIEDGTVRVEYHNLPILGEDSVLLAQGSVAAAKQGKFIEYHRYVFDKQVAQQPVEATENGLAGVAKEIGVSDLAKFRADLTSEETRSAVTSARERATDQLGITGTPAFIVGYSYVPGFVPTETMDKIIAAELARPAR
ncbi:DsbA family protein [Trueperella pyogenes]|uniref:DsbA family protein n=1 Tax=Trueperella pyogenes TaxID=1661 RepID=UPI00345CC3C7